MKIMNRPRRGGKTYELLGMLGVNDILVVCDEIHRRNTILMGLQYYPKVEREYWEKHIVAATTLHKLRGRILANTRVYVDNVEHVLAMLLGQIPDTVTTTSELV